MIKYTLHKLINGLRIISAPIENTKATTLFILVGAGSRYEKASENGIAHFLEHMFFKGTTKRPKTIDIARDLDTIGANFNAFTGEEYTGFYVRAESKNFDISLDVLSDMLFNSKFIEKEIEKEKGVIIEEINMISDLPQAYVEYVMKELLYGDSPLGRMITGTAKTIRDMDRDNFIEFFSRNYSPKNVIIVAAGSKDNDWLEKIKEKFSKFPKISAPIYEKINTKQTEPQLKIKEKNTDQAHFILGYRGIKRTDPKRPILKVLNNIFGATMSSRLFTEVREKRGLCYYISSDIADYIDTGFWGVAAGVDISRIEEALKVILEEFKKIKTNFVTHEELKRAKENLRGHFYLGLEESMNVAQLLAERELFWGEIKDPDELMAEIDKVSKDDILKLAQEIIKPKNLNLAIIGPYKENNAFIKLLTSFASWRVIASTR